jgi:putative transposase
MQHSGIRGQFRGPFEQNSTAKRVLYRRNRLPGRTFFFTVTLAERHRRLLVEHVSALRTTFRAVRRERPFETVATVVLPDRLHALWALPEVDDDYPGRWRAIKSRFTRALRARDVPLMSDGNGGYRLWQHRYWEHTIRDEGDLQRHLDDIHFNPVKHGWVARVADWPLSSFHRTVRRGWLPLDWGGGLAIDEPDRFGE